MNKKKAIKIFYIRHLIIFLFCFLKINAQNLGAEAPPKYEIHIKFGGTGLKTVYCDDNIVLYHTDNINFYKLNENGLKENINPLLLKGSNEDYCASPIKYNVNSIEEKIIIEFIGSPNKLKQLFAGSHISKLERFDYPFPVYDSDINGMFFNCQQLTFVDLSNFSFINVKDISKMFYYCSKLETIIFPSNEKAINIENFSDMFAFSKNIKAIDLSSFSFINAKDVGYMFNNCSNLEEIIFPQNEKAEKIQIMSDIFHNCQNLVSIDLSNFSFKNVRNMAFMFNGCTNLVSIKFPLNEKATSLLYCKNMFSDCSKLASIDLSGFSFINIGDISSMFYGCSNLETLILPEGEQASNIQDFSNMFNECSKLISIDLSNIDFVNAKQLSFMF